MLLEPAWWRELAIYMLTNYYYDRLIVYCVMKKMETIPDIRAKNFFHLCS